MNLPAELRLKIYEYTLSTSTTIEITQDIRKPALLHTCRLIRHEALEIWYAHNTFQLTVTDCDGSLFRAFFEMMKRDHINIQDPTSRKAAAASATRPASKPFLGIPTKFTGKSWPNLLAWCEIAWKENCCYVLEYDGRASSTFTVVHSALDLAQRCSGTMRWEQCLGLLDALRRVAGKVDRKWLEG